MAERPSLVERAQREYEALISEDYQKNRRFTSPNARSFDFMTSPDDTVPVPIHDIEARREERRRRGHADCDTSKQEFAASLGIGVEDTRDPDSGHSVLDVTEAMRAYYGDPEDEAFRNFRYNMMHMSSDIAFLKETTFVGSDIQLQHEQMRHASAYLRKQQQEQNTGDGGGAGTSEDDVDPLAEHAARSAAALRMLESQYGRAHQETLRQYRERRGGEQPAAEPTMGSRIGPIVGK